MAILRYRHKKSTEVLAVALCNVMDLECVTVINRLVIGN